VSWSQSQLPSDERAGYALDGLPVYRRAEATIHIIQIQTVSLMKKKEKHLQPPPKLFKTLL